MNMSDRIAVKFIIVKTTFHVSETCLLTLEVYFYCLFTLTAACIQARRKKKEKTVIVNMLTDV